jgi:iron complex outermembrane receptor protein
MRNSKLIVILLSIIFINQNIILAEESKNPTKLHIIGGMTPIGLDRLGKPISIVTHQELLEKSEPTIGELLSSQPGVAGTYFAPGASRPIIRGQSKERVRILENNMTSGDVSRISDDHAISLDPLAIQRVDVLRGPSTLLYGSSAIGGVVNLVDQSIAEELVGKDLTGEIDLRKGNSADDEASGAMNLNGSVSSINWHLSSFYRETDNIEIPGFAESDSLHELHESEETEEGHDSEVEEERISKTLPNSSTLSKGFKIGASKVWGNSFSGLALRVFNTNYGVPAGHAHEEEHDLEHADELEELDQHDHSGVRIDLEQIRLESRSKIELNSDFFKDLKLGLAYSDYEHQELEGSEIGTQFKNHAFESRIELTHQHNDGFEGGIGTQVNWDKLEATGAEAFVPTSESFAPALFAVEDYKISDSLVVQLGGRYEYSNVNPVNLDNQDFNLYNASTGLVWSFPSESQYSLGLNLAYSERSPNATELFANGVHVATNTFEIGSNDLSKEKSLGAELVFRKSLGRLTGSASLFVQNYFDYINLAPSGEQIEEVPVFNYQLEEALFRGFEIETDYKLLEEAGRTLSFYSQLDYVRAENRATDQPLPRITPLRGKLGLRYSVSDLSAFFESVMVDNQDRVAEFELPTAGYYLLNTGASYLISKESNKVYELYLRGTNLTNQEARVHNSFLKDEVPLRGRAFSAGLMYRF